MLIFKKYMNIYIYVIYLLYKKNKKKMRIIKILIYFIGILEWNILKDLIVWLCSVCF